MEITLTEAEYNNLKSQVADARANTVRAIRSELFHALNEKVPCVRLDRQSGSFVVGSSSLREMDIEDGLAGKPEQRPEIVWMKLDSLKTAITEVLK